MYITLYVFITEAADLLVQLVNYKLQHEEYTMVHDESLLQSIRYLLKLEWGVEEKVEVDRRGR